jgi:hypothetical protein
LETDSNKRQAIIREAERYAVDQMLFLWGINPISNTVLQPNVRGYGVAIYDFNNSYSTIWLA